MTSITWQFVTTFDDPLSESIRWKCDSEISHVNVKTLDGKLLGALLEGGIQKREPDYEKFDLQLVVTLPVTDKQAQKFWEYVNSRIGERYNTLGILGIAFGRNLTGTGCEFCSQLQADGIVAANIFRIDKATSKIDPETLRLLLMSQPGASETRIEAAKGAHR